MYQDEAKTTVWVSDSIWVEASLHNLKRVGHRLSSNVDHRNVFYDDIYTIAPPRLREVASWNCPPSDVRVNKT